LTAASATLALNTGVWFRRCRLLIVSPVRGHHRRFQAETPLIVLCRFANPALWWAEVLILKKKDGTPRLDGLKTYLDDLEGKPINTIWNDLSQNRQTARYLQPDNTKRNRLMTEFSSYRELSLNRTEGRDFQIRKKQRASRVAIIAPHGGTIEPGTSKLPMIRLVAFAPLLA